MNHRRALLMVCLLAASSVARAFESDVHVGLTQWLALEAGFDPVAAKAIAIGNGRVDSGDMPYVDVVFMYACLTKDDFGSRRAGEHHYPSNGVVPGPPESRAVAPGSDAARKAAQSIVGISSDQAPYRLFKLGEALHILQDSWSHQGVPDVPQSATMSLACDGARAWGHPKSRGGWHSHKADLTRSAPADTMAMAKATYEVLTQYPSLAGQKRSARKWEEIRPALDRFVAASTKSEKKQWFVAHGIDDVDFLAETSLPDGAQPFARRWQERKLPPLTSTQSRQHEVPADLLDFYNRFFERWVSGTDFAALANDFGPQGASKSDLVARLKAWRLRDHGRIADIAHSDQPLTARERAAIDAAAKSANAFVVDDPPAATFFPLLPRGEGASPLVPFFIGTSASAVFAVTKFRHAPNDAVVVVGKKIDGRWRVMSIFAAVDH